jgi:hypothetical protein
MYTYLSSVRLRVLYPTQQERVIRDIQKAINLQVQLALTGFCFLGIPLRRRPFQFCRRRNFHFKVFGFRSLKTTGMLFF